MAAVEETEAMEAERAAVPMGAEVLEAAEREEAAWEGVSIVKNDKRV